MKDQYLGLPVKAKDAAFGLMADFDEDPDPRKVSLIAGAYRDENGKPWVLPSVRKAKERIGDNTTHEYLGIEGSPSFIDHAKSLAFGPAIHRLQDNIASIQTVSGTGANHLAATFLSHYLRPKRVFIPHQTWINHRSIWEAVGVEVAEYPYLSMTTKAIDMVRLLDALEHAEPNDVIILQACAHNPTGVDFSKPQWMRMADLVRRKKIFTVFDSAYQGFATGDIDNDAWAIRYFMEDVLKFETHPGICVAQSFSKNFGLYGERVGALHLLVPQSLSAQGARSAMVAIARAEYSNPPRFGATIVETILADPILKAQWIKDLQTMSLRIYNMRCKLKQMLEKETNGDWSHLEKQIGMFSYTGLTDEQVSQLRACFHVYLLPSGRMSMCGLNESNIEYVAFAITSVVKAGKRV